ncbi:hypothetical protein AJ79_00442 [Helicocarpus griseus UAMH5409]|uniref:Carbohydrate kinase PfkB domain-containing protein n=1 Tax=Helicocarpus griseus UAMH5409 TaxID=1447875 RepID=A0A2B7YAU5_9EURO|nr:hypothetical protein AJ79_00442 [Helicocarpus griseus UAMH5409]
MAPKTISVIGGLDYDLIMIANRIPTGGESLLANEKPVDVQEATVTKTTVEQDGEAKATTASSLAQHRIPDNADDELEINVRMVGAVGDDKYGERFYADLNKNGIDSSGVITVPNTQSSICFVMVENDTRENRCLFTLGATATWKKEHFLTDGVFREVVEQMIETAGKAGIDFCLNAAPANPITKGTYRHITHLLVNKSEAAVMSGRNLDEVNHDTWPTICQEFLNKGVKNVVITLGTKGAYYATSGARGYCPAYEIKVVDTTGAGDTFTGAYASDYLCQKETGQWDIRRAVVRANKAAALAITKMGAQKGIPWADEIDAFNAPVNELGV